MNKKDFRKFAVIEYLLRQNHPAPVSLIAKETGINPNTLKKDLPDIEKFLENFRIVLDRKPGVGFWLRGNKKSLEELKKEIIKIRKKLSPYDTDGFIIKTFLVNEKYPTIEDLCDILGVSRPTVLKHISVARNWFKKFGIKLVGRPGVGYSLVYEEENLRNAMCEFIENFEKEKTRNFMGKVYSDAETVKVCFDTVGAVEFSPIIKFINKLESVTNTELTDRDYVIFALKIAITIKRLKQRHIIFYEGKKLIEVMQNPTYRTVYSLLFELERYFKIKFPPEEVAYVTLAFISSKVQETSMLDFDSNAKNKLYTRFAKEIATVADNIFGLPIAKDSEFIHMLALHLKSTFNKIKYGLKIKNPLLEEIKEEYPISFDIARKVSVILGKKVGITIPEEESGYIAMYIATAVEKLKYKKNKRKKVAVVCAMAMGTSSLLFWRLVNEMPDIDVVQVGSYKDIVEGKIGSDIDLIISTIPLPELKVPHIVVSPFLGSRERKEIREILGIVRQKIPRPTSEEFEEIIRRSVIVAHLDAKSAEEAISILATELSKKGVVREGFAESVINREREFPTGLNTFVPIALPHTEAKYSKKEAFAIATLKNPVIFREMGDPSKKVQVKIILMPVLTKHSNKNAVFYDLLRKCRDRNTVPRLLNAKTSIEIVSLLEKPLPN